MSHEQHHLQAGDHVVACDILTMSDTRSKKTDLSGKLIYDLLTSSGYRVRPPEIIPDDLDEIRNALKRSIGRGVDAVFANGGTGISKRDVTIEAILPLLDKELPGFGEMFRYLSFEEIGPSAMLSRATAGTYGDTLVFCLPGSTGAVRLAMEGLILPELQHMAWILARPNK